MSGTRALLLLIILWAAHPAAAIDTPGALPAGPLDRQTVLQLARERAVDLQRAQVRRDQARGELRTARTWRHNPELELEAGPRQGADGETWDRSVGLSQRLDLFGRGARSEAASQALTAAGHDEQSVEISVLAEAARLHLRAVHAGQQQDIAAEALQLHERLLDIARRRLEAGETGRVDVHQATLGAARARMALATAAAEQQDILAELARLLAVEPGTALEVAGDLAWSLPADPEAIRTAALAHPQLEALTARGRAQAASTRLAGAAGWPELGIGASVGREESADIVHFGLSVGLPLFNRGQGERQTAAAGERLAAITLTAARRARQDGALRAWNRHRDLAGALQTAAPVTTDALTASGRLALQSYQLGEISLDRVLLVERENLDARRELNDLRLAVALAAVNVAEIAALPPLYRGKEETP